MYVQNILMRSIVPITESFISEKHFSKEIIILLLELIGVVAGALLFGYILHKSMRKNSIRSHPIISLTLSATVAIALFLRYGSTVTMLQGLFLFYLLIYASMSDLTDRSVPNHISISILALSLISVPSVGIVSMLLGGAIAAAIQIGISVMQDNRYGGADWKISSACAVLLGWQRGLSALALGLFIGVIFTLIYNHFKNRENSEGFPLVPFLSVGTMILFLV